AFEGNKSFQEGFKNGLLCNLLNPKAFLFFLSIFSQFISADTHSWIRWIYGFEVVCAITGWFVFLSYIISSRAFQSVYQRFRKWIDRFLGGILLYFAFRIYKGVLSR
ncbi:MAG: LysE family transporter, partial [Clostridia bacterium]|nr:LysE family transporter [Clostridia bacterium]